MPTTNGRGSSGASAQAERVALYLRVSSEEQRDRETIEIQEEFLDQYCGLYELEVAETYKDDGISGTIPLHERPEGRRLLEDAKAGRFGAVIVRKLDRLGRTLLVIVDAHDRLSQVGVALRSATEPIDTSTPSGRLIFQMLASFAEYDRENIRERTQAGLHRAYRGGKHTGCIPYGYDITPDGSFVVIEEEASVVREMLACIAEGSTLYGEAKRLNDEGVPSPGVRYRSRERRHGTSWTPSTVARIVAQRAYSGIHEVTLEGGEVVEREVPAIVSPSLQERAARALAENKRCAGGKAQRHNYLLRGLVFCAKCGAAYVGTSTAYARAGKRYYYYSCSRRNRRYDEQTKALSCPRVGGEWLEETVWADVRWFLENPEEALEDARAQLLAADDDGELETRLASLTRRLATKQAEKGRYIKLYAQGHLDDEELETHLLDLKNQVENLKLLIASVESDLATRVQDRVAAQDAATWLLTLRERVAELEAHTEEAHRKRRELVRLLVKQITVDTNEDGATEVRITYRFGPPTAQEADGFSHGVADSLLWYRRQIDRCSGRRREHQGLWLISTQSRQATLSGSCTPYRCLRVFYRTNSY